MENYTVSIPALEPLASGHGDSPAGPILAGLPLNVDDVIAAQNQYRKRKRLHKVNYATQLEVSAAMRRNLQVEIEHARVGAIEPAWPAGLQATLDNLARVINDLDTGLQALARTVNDPDTGLQTLARTVNDPDTGLQALARTVNDPDTGLQALARTVNDPDTGLQALARTVNDPDTGLQALARTVNDPDTGLQALARTVHANAFLMEQEFTRNMNRSSIRTIFDPITPIFHPNGQPNWMPQRYTEVLNCNEDEADIFISFYNVVIPENPTLAIKRIYIRNFLGITI